jgi:hypothetical protein
MQSEKWCWKSKEKNQNLRKRNLEQSRFSQKLGEFTSSHIGKGKNSLFVITLRSAGSSLPG